MPSEYAHALKRALEETTTETQQIACVEELFRVLQKDGKQKALPSIARELERIFERATQAQAVLTVATSDDEKKARAELLNRLPNAQPTHTNIDEEIIGGWRYTESDTLIDASHKQALIELYRRIVVSV